MATCTSAKGSCGNNGKWQIMISRDAQRTFVQKGKTVIAKKRICCVGQQMRLKNYTVLVHSVISRPGSSHTS